MRFWRLLQPDKAEIRNVYIYSVFNGLVALSLPLGIQAIINLIQGGQVNATWIVLVAFVVLGVAANGLLNIYQLRIVENLQQKIFGRAAFEFAYRMPRIRMEALARHYAPELMNRFFDVVSVQKGLAKILIDFTAAAVQVLFGLMLLSVYHPFFIIFSIVLLLLAFGIFRLTGKRGLRTSLEESKHKYQVAYWLEELARTNTTFKLAGTAHLPMQRIDRHVDSYLDARQRHFSVLMSQYGLMVGFKVVVAAGLLVIGSILVMEQFMNLGQFVAAEIIILLVINSVEKLISTLETIYDVLTSLEKVGQVTDMELEASDGRDLAADCGDCGLTVTLEDVGITFPDRATPALRNINLHIRHGETVVVKGASGSGKSALLQVLAGLYKVEGRVLYNDYPVGSLEPGSLRKVIGDCLSQEQLFQGTVYENIAMGRGAATQENVDWAVRKLHLREFITSLPKGIDTELHPGGMNLPRSVVQKLLLARSVADKPRLLLLDKALEFVPEDELPAIIGFLTAADKPWTLVAVSNDELLTHLADQTIELSNGELLPEPVNA